ncbi:MAG: G elongation factor, mitochondrial 2 [Marteilia pararefringens]
MLSSRSLRLLDNTRAFLLSRCSRNRMHQSRASSSLRSHRSPNTSQSNTIGIVSHVDAGKTTLTEAILYLSGTTTSLGSVNEGTTVTDYLGIEKKRGITVNSVAVNFAWPKTNNTDESNVSRVNLIDTPGHAEFQFEVQRSLAALDSVIVVVDGTRGVQAQTYAYFVECRRRSLPCMFFVNKSDCKAFDLSASISSIDSRLKADSFLLEKDRFGNIFSANSRERQFKVPANCQHFNEFLEMLSILDSKLIYDLEKLDDCGEIQNVLNSAKRSFRAGLWFPVIEGSAKELRNVSFALDTFLYLSFDGFQRSVSGEDFEDAVIDENSTEDSVALLFKNQHLPNSSHVYNYYKVLQGRFESNKTYFIHDLPDMNDYGTNRVIHPRSSRPLGIKKLLYNRGKKELEEGDSSGIGDVFTIADPHFTSNQNQDGSTIGNKSCSERRPVATGSYLLSKSQLDQKLMSRLRNFPTIMIPGPIFFMNVEPIKSKDRTQLLHALNEISLSDPSLVVEENDRDGSITIGAQGKIHIEVLVAKLEEFYGIDAKIKHSPLRLHKTVVRESPSVREDLVNAGSWCSGMSMAIVPSDAPQYLQRIVIPKSTRDAAIEQGIARNLWDDEAMLKAVAASIRSFEIKSGVECVGLRFEALPCWPEILRDKREHQIYQIGKITSNCLDLILQMCEKDILKLEESASIGIIEILNGNLMGLIVEELRGLQLEVNEIAESTIIRKGKRIVVSGASRHFFTLPTKLSSITSGFFNLNIEQNGRVDYFEESSQSKIIKNVRR